MNRNLKFNVYLLLYKKIEGSEEIKRSLSEISTYLPYATKFYIFNYCKEDQVFLIEELKTKYGEMEYAKIETKGEVADYTSCVEHAIKVGCDYVTFLRDGYFYEDDSYHKIQTKIIQGEFSNLDAVISPLPIYTCEAKSDEKLEKRNIKGAHLVGTFINTHIYQETSGFYEPYYRTTYDYDYCLMVRQKGYNVVLMNNLVLRNRNFKQLQKNVLWHYYTAYQRDIYDVYYETRNRMLLWEKYKKFDPEYVKLDRKQQSYEFKEMRLFEKKYAYIKEIISQAREDFRKNKMGKTFNEIQY